MDGIAYPSQSSSTDSLKCGTIFKESKRPYNKQQPPAPRTKKRGTGGTVPPIQSVQPQILRRSGRHHKEQGTRNKEQGTRNKEQGKYSLVKKSRVKKLFQRIKAIRNHHAFYNPYSNYRYRVRESQGDWQGTDRRRTSVQDIGGLSTFRILCTKIQYPLIA